MDVEVGFWAARVLSSKHLSAMQNSALNSGIYVSYNSILFNSFFLFFLSNLGSSFLLLFLILFFIFYLKSLFDVDTGYINMYLVDVMKK